MASRRCRGFGLIEGIVAVSALALVTAGAFVGWTVMLRKNIASHQNGLAAQLARAEIEKAKLYGADTLPLGTYSAGSGTALWNGSYDATANSGAGGWVLGGTSYYDGAGNQVASATSSGVTLAITDAITDTSVLAAVGGGYLLQPTSQRELVTTVVLVSDGSTILRMGTTLVEGGL